MHYQNDVSATVEVDFEPVRDVGYFKPIWDAEPYTCLLKLDGKAFDLCSKDPAKVLQDMRRHMWVMHEADMREQAFIELSEHFAEAAE